MKKLLFALLPTVFAFSLEPVVEPIKTKPFELQFSAGYSDYKEDYLGETWYAKLNADLRVKYPFLVGIGALVSSSSDVFMAYPEMRIKVRAPLFSTLKFDPFVAVSVGYAENKSFDKKKTLAGASVGFQLLYFSPSEVHFGIEVSYSFYTDERFNAFRAGFVIGF